MGGWLPHSLSKFRAQTLELCPGPSLLGSEWGWVSTLRVDHSVDLLTLRRVSQVHAREPASHGPVVPFGVKARGVPPVTGVREGREEAGGAGPGRLPLGGGHRGGCLVPTSHWADCSSGGLSPATWLKGSRGGRFQSLLAKALCEGPSTKPVQITSWSSSREEQVTSSHSPRRPPPPPRADSIMAHVT